MRLLCDGLVDHGHDVTLFAPPTSTSSADVRAAARRRRTPTRSSAAAGRPTTSRAPSPRSTPPRRTGARSTSLHDHTGYAALAMADRAAARRSSTRCTARSTTDNRDFYATHGRKATLVAISRAQARGRAGGGRPVRRRPQPPGLRRVGRSARAAATTSCGSGAWRPSRARTARSRRRAPPASRSCWPGRCSPARRQFFAEEVEPHVDDDAVRYVGEVGAERQARRSTATRARCSCRSAGASRSAWSWSRRWPAARRSSPSRRARPPRSSRTGSTGFVVDDEDAMARAIGRDRTAGPRGVPRARGRALRRRGRGARLRAGLRPGPGQAAPAARAVAGRARAGASRRLPGRRARSGSVPRREMAPRRQP